MTESTSGHHALFECGILHRDISKNNVMCRRRKDGKVIGILLDFDLAIFIEEDGKAPDPTSKFRTGTLAFMAIDLLEDTNIPHLYRHDLESFLYVLVWISCYYNAGKITSEKLPSWCVSSRAQLADAKRKFLQKQAQAPTASFYRPVQKSWIWKFAYILNAGYNARMSRNSFLGYAKLAKEQLEPGDHPNDYVVADIVEKMINSPDDADYQEHPKDIISLYGNATFGNFRKVFDTL